MNKKSRSLLITAAVLVIGMDSDVIAQGRFDLPEKTSMVSNHDEDARSGIKRIEQLLSAKVSVKGTGSTIAALIEIIANQIDLRVNYAETGDIITQRVSVNLQNVSAINAIKTILTGTGLEVVPLSDGRTVVIRPVRRGSEKTDTTKSGGSVSGRVVDSASKGGIEGVIVTIVGTNLKVVTDKKGGFQFANVPIGSQIVSVRLMGYKSQNVNVNVALNGTSNVSIAISAAATVLNEVVTTVTGEQKKLEIGNDITTIDVPEVMKQAPITSVTDLLEGRVPGLTVVRSSGVPGASSRIRLRGIGGGLLAGTPGAPTNDPIVIVDGIRIYAGQSGVNDQKLGGDRNYPTPSPIDQIDPNSIEKIEVLRGPSAAAMYGSDAGDGVIIITTKKGKAGTPSWGLGLSKGIEYMPGTYAAPGYYRFGHMPGGQWLAGGGSSSQFCPTLNGVVDDYFKCLEDSIVRFQALNEPRLSTVDRGNNSKLTGTVSGGTQDLAYSVTGSFANTLGLTKMPELYQDLFKKLYDSVPGKRMKRPNTMSSKSGQASLSGQFGNGLSAVYSTSLSQSIQQQSSANEQLANLASAYIDTMNISPGRPGQYAYRLNVKNNSLMHALSLTLNKLDWFPMTSTFGMDRLERGAEGMMPRGIVSVQSENFSTGSYLPNVILFTNRGEFTERLENMQTNTARVVGTLFPRYRVSVSLGSEITKRSTSAVEGKNDTLAEGITRPTSFDRASREGRTSTTGGWFVEPRLNMNSRFFVNPGFRLDGSGVSGSRGGLQGGLLSLFPKLNFSWIAIDREGRDPLFGAISLVRPRMAFGIAGVPPGAEMSLRTFEPSPIGGIENDLGIGLRSIGNTRLGPEKTQEVEGGLDLQLWETRLTVSVTGFIKVRKNAIQQLPLAPSIGSRSVTYYSNIGHVRNTGGELSLNAVVIDNENFGWNIDLSVSGYRNKLTKLYGDKKSIDLGGGSRFVEGYPLFGRWSVPIAGWIEPQNGKKISAGDYTLADSAIYMGLQSPDFEMPFRTSISLLRGLLTLNGDFNYKSGLTQSNLGGGALLGNIYDNPMSTPGQQAYALAAACYLTNGGGGACEDLGTDYGFIQKISSLRFNSISVGYNVPREYLKQFPISSLSLSLQGSNIGLWTNYRGKDPDVNGNLIGDATVDSGQLPMPRTWNLMMRIGT